MSRFLLALWVLALVLVQAGGANGSESYRESLTINVVGIDGSKRVLSRHNIVPGLSSLSPDSRLLAYLPAAAPREYPRELWVANVREPGERLVFQSPGWIYTFGWAPDGRAIALSMSHPSQGIWLIQPDGTGLRKVAGPGSGFPFGLSWSPDSRQLLYNRSGMMALLDVATGSSRDLAEGQNVGWSPDGDEILYQYERRGCSCLPEIRVFTVRSGVSRTLARGLAPRWSPDGSRIAYTRTRTGRRRPHSLWVVSSSGGKPRLLANRAGTGIWSPNGRWHAFIRLGRGSCKTHLILVSVRNRRTRPLVDETRYITPVKWTRRGLLYTGRKCLP